MIISTVCFISDLYFYINHKKNLENLQNNDATIVFVHLLIVRTRTYIAMTTCIAKCYIHTCVNKYGIVQNVGKESEHGFSNNCLLIAKIFPSKNYQFSRYSNCNGIPAKFTDVFLFQRRVIFAKVFTPPTFCIMLC